MSNFVVFCVTTIILLSNLIDSEDSQVLVVFKHSVCSWNKKYVNKVLCPRKPVNRTTSLTSFDIFLKPGVSLTSPLFLQLISYRKFATQYKPVLVNMKVDLCNFVKDKYNPVWLIHDADQYKFPNSNIFEPCPIEGHKFMKPYYTNYREWPPLIPIGMWRVDIIILKGEEEVVKIQNYYEVTAKGIIEF